MKRLLIFMVILVGAGGLIFWLLENTQGSMLVSTQHLVVEFSLSTALLVALMSLATIGLLYFLLRLLLTPGWRMLVGRKQRRLDRWTQKNLQGRIALAEGRWDIAQQYLLDSADKLDPPTELLSYLAAAVAAAEQGNAEDALATLRRAENSSVGDELTIGVARARLLVEQSRYQEAQEQLLGLHGTNVKQPYVLILLAKTYRALGQWDKLEQLLPDLQRNNGIDKSALADWQGVIRRGQLQHFGQPEGSGINGLKQLELLWSRVEKAIKTDPGVLGDYGQALIRIGEGNVAETVLRKALNKFWDDDLALQYGQCASGDSAKQLAVAERWLSDRSDNADLLLTLGRLCKRNELWGKARDYLEASQSLNKRPETLAELAIVMAHLGDHESSRQYFQRGFLESLELEDELLPESA